jgi:type IV pilus assembly protein PilA
MKNFLNKVAKSFRAGEKGFTLIELLIVIVILGVLAAAIIPNLSKFVGSGKVGAANAEVASVRTAISAYIADSTSGTPPYSTGTTIDNTLIQGYISGVAIKATYTYVAATGVIGSTDHSYDADLHWDVANQKWIKP